MSIPDSTFRGPAPERQMLEGASNTCLIHAHRLLQSNLYVGQFALPLGSFPFGPSLTRKYSFVQIRLFPTPPSLQSGRVCERVVARASVHGSLCCWRRRTRRRGVVAPTLFGVDLAGSLRRRSSGIHGRSVGIVDRRWHGLHSIVATGAGWVAAIRCLRVGICWVYQGELGAGDKALDKCKSIMSLATLYGNGRRTRW